MVCKAGVPGELEHIPGELEHIPGELEYIPDELELAKFGATFTLTDYRLPTY